MPKPIIYAFCVPSPFPPDVAVYALDESGERLACHISSSVAWAQKDIGYIEGGHCEYRREIYAQKYPDGYALIWLDEPQLATHEGYQKALALNRAKVDKLRIT